MLSNKQISQRFEVQVNTLYNWQKSKPKLYSYLQNADYNQERHQEINVLLQEYSKSIQKSFTLEQIEYLLHSKLELVTIKQVQNFEKHFIESEYKNIPTKSTLLMSIYDTILELNLIEKYILYKKIHKLRQNPDISTHIQEFFKEYLQ